MAQVTWLGQHRFRILEPCCNVVPQTPEGGEGRRFKVRTTLAACILTTGNPGEAQGWCWGTPRHTGAVETVRPVYLEPPDGLRGSQQVGTRSDLPPESLATGPLLRPLPLRSQPLTPSGRPGLELQVLNLPNTLGLLFATDSRVPALFQVSQLLPSSISVLDLQGPRASSAS